MTFPKFTRLKRQATGLSQQMVADTLNLSHRSDVLRKETGQIQWHFPEIVLLARMYNVQVSEFIKEWENS